MACIAPETKAFKDLMKKQNLSEQSLMAAIKIWRSEDPTGKREDSDQLPSDEWFEQYKGKKQVVGSQAQRQLWEQNREPKTFDSKEQAIQEYNRLVKFFGKDGVYTFSDTSGKVTIGVYEQIEPNETQESTPEITLKDGGNVIIKSGKIQLSESGNTARISVQNGQNNAAIVLTKEDDVWKVGFEGLIDGQFPVKSLLVKKMFRQAIDYIKVGESIGYDLGSNILNLTDNDFQALGLVYDGKDSIFHKTEITTADLHVTEHTGDYAARTRANAQLSSLTLALAEDMTTPGERLTRNAAGVKYLGHEIGNVSAKETADRILDDLRLRNNGVLPKDVNLNIAGNSINNLSQGQEYYDQYVTDVLKYLLEAGVTISEVRSGGQTGIDEAGIKAAQNLGLNWTVLAPKGYKYRNSNGADITGNKNGFIDRFNREFEPVKWSVQPVVEGPKAIRKVYITIEKSNRVPFKAIRMLTSGDYMGITDSDRIEHIKYMLSNGELGIGNRIIVDPELPASEVISTTQVLRKMAQYQIFSTADPIQIPTDEISPEDVAAYKKAGFQIDEEHRAVIVPTFTIGYSQYEMELQRESAALRAGGLFKDSELRALAKGAILKLSDEVTKLNTDPQRAKQLFGDNPDYQKYVRDYTKMSRIDILDPMKGIGLETLLNIVVKEAIFNVNNNPQFSGTEGMRKFNNLISNKMHLIHDNFRAFILLGYDSLIGLESVSFIDGYRKTVTPDDFAESGVEIFSQEDEQMIQEVYGSSAEHWQVGFRQVSAIQSLSQQIKRKLGKLYQMNPDGSIITNEFGMGQTIDVQKAVTSILAWTQGANTLDDMISQLQKHLKSEPWLNQLVGEYHAGGVLDNAVVQGILLDKKNNDQFRSQFFSNFRKYFQMYAITYKDKDGKTMINGLNTTGYTDALKKELESRASKYEEGHEKGGLKIWNPKIRNFSEDFRRLENVLGERENPLAGSLRHFAAGKKDAPVTRDILEKISGVYNTLDIEPPTLEELRVVFPTAKEVGEFADQLEYTIRTIKKGQDGFTPNLFSGKNSSWSNYKRLAEFIAPIKGVNVEAVSYEAGKMHYGYVNPSYLGTLIGKLSGDVQNYEAWIQEQYGKITGWFFTPKGALPEGLIGANPWIGTGDSDTGWMNYWLEQLMTNPAERKRLEHIVSLSDNKVAYTDKSDAQYISSLVSMFFYDATKTNAYFAVPTLSNKPSEEYIKFRRIHDDYENFITKQLVSKVFIQEVNRIRTVRERIKDYKDTPEKTILHFDNEEQRGKEFQFLDFLNPYLNHKDSGNNTAMDKFSKALQKYISGERFNDSDFSAVLGQTQYTSEYQYFVDALPILVRKKVNERFVEFMQEMSKNGFLSYANLNMNERGDVTGNVTKVFQIEDVIGTGETGLENLKEFFWNDMFGSINILQLTVTDLALYKDTEDVQKRLAQLHAPGVKGNLQALDFTTGESVTDGLTRTVYLADSINPSQIMKELGEIHDKLKQNPRFTTDGKLNEGGKKYAQMLKTVEKAFSKTDWANAQGYSSPTSYRKKMHIFGKWDQQQEDAYQRIIKGDFSIQDLDVLWQPLKPFVYTQITKANDTGIGMPFIKMGVQNKNSEYLLIMADALARGTGEKTILNAIFDVMEESARVAPGMGIDTIQFESAVKIGLMGKIDLNGLSYDEAKKKLRDSIYKDSRHPDLGYDDTFVHELPFEDYAIQQEVPPHFEGSQQQGSQDRVLAITDMPEVDYDGNVNTVNVQFGNGASQTMTVKEAKEEYYKAITENIEESAKKLRERLGINNPNQKLQNIALSRLLREEILKDGRYGSDTLWACSTNEDGEFNVPLSDPLQAGRIQQLLNSIIKNTINKQEVPGGPVVQVSSWGAKTSDQLHVVLNPDGTVKHFEAFVPIWDDQLIYDFGIFDEKDEWTGKIDVKKMEKVNPKLLQMIGYRIPTEGKYSMVPIKVVGFLPKNAGEGIMLPAELTTLSGSDFDVDKLYIMRYAINKLHKNRTSESFSRAFVKQHYDAFKDSFTKSELQQSVEELIYFGDRYTPEEFTEEQAKQIRASYAEYMNPVWVFSTEKTDMNNNRMLDIHWAMLTSGLALDQFLTAQNFDEPKRVGYMIAAIDNNGGDASSLYDSYAGKEPKALKDIAYKKSNIIFANTKVNFHRQNMVAAKLIGVFAQANVSHGFIGLHTDDTGQQDVTIAIDDKHGFVLKDINNQKHIIKQNVPIDREYSWDGVTRESSILANLLAASVDAVKDPILNLMNVNLTTVNVAVALVRLGMDIETIGWFLSTPIIKELVQRYNEENIKAKTGIDKVVKNMQKELSKDKKLVFDNRFAFGKDFFIEKHNGHTNQEAYNLLELFSRVNSIANTFRNITHMTKYNSITSAVGPYAANTAVMRMQDEDFNNDKHVTDSLRRAVNNPILLAFREATVGANGKEGLESEILGRRIVQAGPIIRRILKTAKSTFGYMTDDLARELTDFSMAFIMNLENPLFDLSYDNRKYMLEEFPQKYSSLAEKYADNPFIKAITVRYEELDPKNHEGNYFLELKTKGLLSENLEDIKAGWTQLFKDEEARIENEGAGENLALKLLEYNFFRGGLGFDPRTFTQLAPAAVKLGLPGYLEKLQRLENGDMLFFGMYENLIHQFMLNKGRANMGYINPEALTNVSEKDGRFTARGDLNIKPFFASDEKYGIARLGSEWVYAWYNVKRRILTYQKVDKLGGNNGDIFEIDPSTKFYEMKSLYETITPSETSQNNDYEGSPSQFTPEIEDLIGDGALRRILNIWGYKPFQGYVDFAEGFSQLLHSLAGGAGLNTELAPHAQRYKELAEQLDKNVDYKQIIKTINEENLCG